MISALLLIGALMSDHYTRIMTFPPGNLARGETMEAAFDNVSSGFDSLEIEVDETLRFTGGGFSNNGDFTASPLQLSTTAANRSRKVLGCSNSGASFEFINTLNADDTFELTPAASNVNDFVTVTSTGDWQFASQPGSSLSYGGVLAPHKNLEMYWINSNLVGLNFDFVMVRNEDGDAEVVDLAADFPDNYSDSPHFNVSLNEASGFGPSYDLGELTEEASTWYYVFVIWGPEDEGDPSPIIRTMLSKTTTPDPSWTTNEPGFTYYGLVGAVYNDASKNLKKMHQLGTRVWLAPDVAVKSTAVTTSIATNAMPAHIPPDAASWWGWQRFLATATPAGKSFTIGPESTLTQGVYVIDAISITYRIAQFFELPLTTAQTFYSQGTSTAASIEMYASGYRWA